MLRALYDDNHDHHSTTFFGGKHPMRKWQRPLILASSSPRRVQLLTEAGIEAIVYPPELDDGVFRCGSMEPTVWVLSLAVLKAQHVREIYSFNTSNTSKVGTILAADTVCVVDGQLYGQPVDAEEAAVMIRAMEDRSHDVYTGWCLVSVDEKHFASGCEHAVLTIGQIGDEEIHRYIASNQWQGKAGGYNLAQQIAAGWPITCKGDPTSVMGLPMERMKQELMMDQN